MSEISDVMREIKGTSVAVAAANLAELSGLDTEGVREFRLGWPAVSEERRREVVSRLAELAEENVEIDYTAVFVAGLEDEDSVVRARSARALWECDDRSVIRALVALLETDPSNNVKAAVATSLGRIVSDSQGHKVIAADTARVRRALLGAAADVQQDIEVRRRAVEAVAAFDDEESRDVIGRAYAAGDTRLKISSIYAMGRSADVRWLPALVKERNDESPAVRFEVAGALGLLGEDDTIVHLLPMLDDDDPEVQAAAAQALGRIGGAQAKQVLEEATDSGDDPLAEAAREALEEIGFDEDPLAFRYSQEGG